MKYQIIRDKIVDGLIVGTIEQKEFLCCSDLDHDIYDFYENLMDDLENGYNVSFSKIL